MPELSLQLLGPFSATLDGRPLTRFRTKAVQALLIYLACQPEPHRRESIIELFWPGTLPKSGRDNLRQTLSRLRRLLPEMASRSGREPAPFLLSDRQTVQANPEVIIDLDVATFEKQIRSGGIEEFESAVALYRGEFLGDFYLPDSAGFEEWAAARRADLRRQALDSLESLASNSLKAGKYETAESYARQQLLIDDLREAACRQLVEALAQEGKRNEALTYYDDFCRRLSVELDVQPTAETRSLLATIREEEAVSEARSPDRTPDRAPSLPRFLSGEQQRPVERSVFVGRERQLARLTTHLDQALVGDGGLFFVCGGAGRGKTALMMEFGRRAMAAHPSLLVVSGGCNAYSGLGDAYLPFRELLGMLTGDVEASWAAGAISHDHARRLWELLPDAVPILLHHGHYLLHTLVSGRALLSRASAAAPDNPLWLQQLRTSAGQSRSREEGLEQSHLFYQFGNVIRALAAEQPLILLLDDLQWSDPASLSLLFHLGRCLGGVRCLVVCAYRPEEVALGRDGERHPLEKLLAEFKRQSGDITIDLGRPEAAEGKKFVDAYVDSEPNRLGEEFRSNLVNHTGGHALFTVELMRTLQERGDLVKDEGGNWVEGSALDWDTLPSRVEAVIEERINRLESNLRESLTIASVEGESFTAQVVAKVQEIGERKLLGMLSQELEKRHRLLRQGESRQIGRRRLSRYRFAHALFQQYLYNDLSLAERHLLHGQIAEILEMMYEGFEEEIAAQLAHHFSLAGDEKSACEYRAIAADDALASYANEEAVAHYRRALDLSPTQMQRADLLSGLGVAFVRQGLRQQAYESWQEGIAHYRVLGIRGFDGLATLHAFWAEEVRANNLERAMNLCQEGLALVAEAPESPGIVRLLLAASHTQVLLEGRGKACHLVRRALSMAESLGESDLQARALTQMGRHPGQSAGEALEALKRAAELADSTGKLSLSAYAHFFLAMELENMDLRVANDHYHQAIELHRRVGTGGQPPVAIANTILNLLWLGELKEADATLEFWHQWMRDAVEPIPRSALIKGLAEAALFSFRGSWDRAAQRLEPVLVETRERGFPVDLGVVNEFTAFALLETLVLNPERQVEQDEIESILTEATEIGDQHRTDGTPSTRCQLSLLYTHQKRFDLARNQLVLAESPLSSWRCIPTTHGAHVRLAQARLAAAERRWTDAFSTFDSAHELLGRLEMRWDMARMRIDWAEAHVNRGEPGDRKRARELLQESLAMFQEMGAPGYEAAVKRRLQAL